MARRPLRSGDSAWSWASIAALTVVPAFVLSGFPLRTTDGDSATTRLVTMTGLVVAGSVFYAVVASSVRCSLRASSVKDTLRWLVMSDTSRSAWLRSTAWSLGVMALSVVLDAFVTGVVNAVFATLTLGVLVYSRYALTAAYKDWYLEEIWDGKEIEKDTSVLGKIRRFVSWSPKPGNMRLPLLQAFLILTVAAGGIATPLVKIGVTNMMVLSTSIIVSISLLASGWAFLLLLVRRMWGNFKDRRLAKGKSPCKSQSGRKIGNQGVCRL